MLTYWTYFKARYLSEKGQGMVEYAVVVGIVVAIGVAVAANNNAAIATAIQNLYTNVFNRAAARITAN
ncbi:pilus assembly protein Flp/PilA [Propionispira arboris]|uniref:Pilus assembly protein Flp/PilA n=1 Tax=Propionispira arboris TaxID=84035 RepID=A0A1H7BQ56_9FIRM|nr:MULTISPECIES: hypothetical protein [Propionispira]SEJ79719.1 pilus assembly protein Flp/PilA [Propionispira arboris]